VGSSRARGTSCRAQTVLPVGANRRVISDDPFVEYDFLDRFLTSELLKPRQQTLPNDPNERELERLRGLSQIVEQLISSVDVQTALDSTLSTLLKVMKLQTGWVSMLTESHLGVIPAGDSPPHGFALAAAHGLPPGLERDVAAFFASRLPATASSCSKKDASPVPSTSSNAHVCVIPCAPQVIIRVCVFTPPCLCSRMASAWSHQCRHHGMAVPDPRGFTLSL